MTWIIGEELVTSYSANMNESWHIFEVMTRGVYCASLHTTIDELMQELTERKINGAPVTDKHGNVLGVVSLSDVAKQKMEDPTGFHELPVKAIMTRRVHTIDQAATIGTAATKFIETGVHRLIVTYNDQVVGILTPGDLLPSLLQRIGYQTNL